MIITQFELVDFMTRQGPTGTRRFLGQSCIQALECECGKIAMIMVTYDRVSTLQNGQLLDNDLSLWALGVLPRIHYTA